MNGKCKVIGTCTTTFKDGTVSGIIFVERDNFDNANGVCVQPYNIGLNNLPVKHLNELVGKDVFISDNGFPKYTWVKDMFIF